ncbi:MAG: hypothetical protein MN733_00625 [Nitrososphaera sp.]|nr:hypothetical protein [Nitrososphaera sp.]
MLRERLGNRVRRVIRVADEDISKASAPVAVASLRPGEKATVFTAGDFGGHAAASALKEVMRPHKEFPSVGGNRAPEREAREGPANVACRRSGGPGGYVSRSKNPLLG